MSQVDKKLNLRSNIYDEGNYPKNKYKKYLYVQSQNQLDIYPGLEIKQISGNWKKLFFCPPFLALQVGLYFCY